MLEHCALSIIKYIFKWNSFFAASFLFQIFGAKCITGSTETTEADEYENDVYIYVLVVYKTLGREIYEVYRHQNKNIN